MNTNAYYTDQELRVQRTNLEAMGYGYSRNGGPNQGDRLLAEIAKELAYRATMPPHPSNLAFGPDEIYDQDN